jgi:dynein heavy chain
MKEGENIYPLFLTFSARTSSIQAQSSIEGKLDSKRKDLLGAPGNKTTVIMIDDVNMPEVEEFGAQPPIELIRMY